MKIPRGQLTISKDAKAFRTQHHAPCMDCPWARKSLKGWTGPHSTWLWLKLAADYWHPIACHTRKVAKGISHPLKRFGIDLGGHWECAGGAIFRANTKVFYYGSNRPLLKMSADTIKVFASPAEFEAHHGEGTGD